MPKVRFLESVYQDGSSYTKDHVYDLSNETIRGLGNSVERLEEDKPQPAPKQDKPKEKEEKAVDAAPVDKQIKDAPKTK